MSEVTAMLQNYSAIRERLRYPPNARPDQGIDLKNKRAAHKPVNIAPRPVKFEILPLWAYGPVIEMHPVYLPHDAAARITIRGIIRTVARFYEVPIEDILSARREFRIVKPRQIAMYLAKTRTRHSLPAIGIQFGGRDHTTILHAVRKIERLRQTDPELNDQIVRLESKFWFTE